MNLKEICAAFRQTPALVLRIPATPATIAADARLSATSARNVATPPDDLDAICLRIDVALSRGGPVSRRDLRHAPWCIWASSRPLSTIPGRIETLLRRIEEAGRRRVYRELAAAYLYFFCPARAEIQLVGAFLAEHLSNLGSPYREAHSELQVFNCEVGPRRILGKALATSGFPDEVFASAGLSDLNTVWGLRAYVYRTGFANFERGDNREALKRLETVRNWIFDGGAVRFEHLRAAAVRAA